MDRTKGFRESEGKGVGTGLGNYLEWTEIFSVSFFEGRVVRK
jgi:hypothetical protein